MIEIALADLSMSCDNVLAVAGAAREHPTVLVIGLGLSVVLIACAGGESVARLLARWRWVAWIGLLIVLIVALRMIHEGTAEVAHQTSYRSPACKFPAIRSTGHQPQSIKARAMDLKDHIRVIPDFPSREILFYDHLSTLLRHADAWQVAMGRLARIVTAYQPDLIAGRM